MDLDRARMDLDRARKILNIAHSAFISMDEDGRITYWNIRAEETFGPTREQAVGRNVLDLIVRVRYREALRQGFRRFKDGGGRRCSRTAPSRSRCAPTAARSRSN